MAIEFNCHVCGRLLRTSDDKAGRTAKCPGCGEALAVPEPVESMAEERRETDRDVDASISPAEEELGDNFAEDASNTTSRLDADVTRTCPMCAETIDSSADSCLYCGEDLTRAASSGNRHARSLDFGEVFSTSWNFFSEDMGLHIGAMLVYMVISLLLIGVGVGIGIAIVIGVAASGDQALTIVVAIVVAVAVWLLIVAVQAYLNAGYNIFLLKSVRGEGAEISDLFAGGPYFVPMLANSLVFNLMVTIGMLFCYVPGIILSLMFWPYSFVVIDETSQGLRPLNRAKELMDGNWGPVLLLFLVAWLIYSGAASFCLFAALFILPWIMVMMALIYCRLTGQRTAERPKS